MLIGAVSIHQARATADFDESLVSEPATVRRDAEAPQQRDQMHEEVNPDRFLEKLVEFVGSARSFLSNALDDSGDDLDFCDLAAEAESDVLKLERSLMSVLERRTRAKRSNSISTLP